MNFNIRGFYQGKARREQLYRVVPKPLLQLLRRAAPFVPAQPRGGALFNAFRSKMMHVNQPNQTMGALFSSRRYIRPSIGRTVFRFHGLGADVPATPAPAPSWLTNLTEFAKQALPAYQQVKILREQEKRRAAGLPPLDTSQLAPTVRVQVAPDAGVMNLGRIALYGGLAIGGTFLAMSLLRRR